MYLSLLCYAQYYLWGLTVAMLVIIGKQMLHIYAYRIGRDDRFRPHIVGGKQSKFVLYSPEKLVLHDNQVSGAPPPSEYKYVYTSHPSGRLSNPSSKDIDYTNVVQGQFKSLHELYRLKRTHLVSLLRLIHPARNVVGMSNMELFTAIIQDPSYHQLTHHFSPMPNSNIGTQSDATSNQRLPSLSTTNCSMNVDGAQTCEPVARAHAACPTYPNCYCFPPALADVQKTIQLVNRFTAELSCDSVSESACAACARLFPTSESTILDINDPVIGILNRPGAGVTRKERKSAVEPIEELTGPILYQGGIETGRVYFCRVCINSMRRQRIPKYSLANGNWVGNVPDCLKRLSFVEKLLVARYRHNCCIVKVAQGGRKLRCNAVIFGQPVQKIVSYLPPTPTDISNVLAIYFTGSKGPDDTTFQRTPLLVRKGYVKAALEWLILNHEDYATVTFSEHNLALYREGDVPVAVNILNTDSDFTASVVSAEQQSVNYVPGSEEEGWRGTEECEFSVSGLTEAEFNLLNYNQMISRAMRHLKEGGRVLAVGHSEHPETMYHNEKLFPGLFPWLYPYGKGGFDSPIQNSKISPATQCCARLLYADRRFQTDEYFMFVAFNHNQIKIASQGSFVSVQRRSWNRIATAITSADVSLLDGIIKKAVSNTLNNNMSSGEKIWMDILRETELVGSNVPGSRASKRRNRGEIRSLLMHSGISLLYITISPCDWKNPIALYRCGERIDILASGTAHLGYPELQRRVAANPVACARFFNYMVTQFINIILGFGTGNVGLFGPVDSYYGTVEEQGRLTLHLHLLLWLVNHLSPQDIKERLQSRVQPFTDTILRYLDEMVRGDYIDSDNSTVEDQIRHDKASGHYIDPTSVLAKPLDENNVCESLLLFQQDVNNLVYLSHRHTHNAACRRNDAEGTCKARFPREYVDKTYVDDDGHIFLMKHESNINTYSPVLTYLIRSNTDVTAILSGTAIKAVLIYITDYITKSSLKTHTIFECIKSVYEKRSTLLSDMGEPAAARHILVKIVNALTSRQQLGGPLIAAYTLGHNDHYTNRRFIALHWKLFVDYVKTTDGNNDTGEDHEMDVNSTDSNQEIDERVLLANVAGRISQYSRMNDWLHRPLAFEMLSLYEYFRVVRKRRHHKKKAKVDRIEPDTDSDSSTVYESDTDDEDDTNHIPINRSCYLEPHPQFRTHYAQRVSDPDRWVVNWVGNALPRLGQGNEEYYYMTMVVIFKPWRKTDDLKLQPTDSWEETFKQYEFTPVQLQLIRNFNILYECLDARDDHAAQRRKGKKINSLLELSELLTDEVCEALDISNDEDAVLKLAALDGMDLDTVELEGREYRRHLSEANRARSILIQSGWQHSVMRGADTNITPCNGDGLSADYWRKRLVSTKNARISDNRSESNGSPIPVGTNTNTIIVVENDVNILGANELSDGSGIQRRLGNDTPHLISREIDSFTLNAAQSDAFSIVVQHAFPSSQIEGRQLIMYLGGMGGTGKSRVINALTHFFTLRNCRSSFAICAPTGSAACLINGSTYHTLLKIGRANNMKPSAELTHTFQKITTIFLDEISMVSCTDLYNISSRLCQIKGNDLPFGGLHMIFAGDFAQLPPVGIRSAPLYSPLNNRSGRASTLDDQKAAIGKGLWHQLNHVVILRENMRLASMELDDLAFRRALDNMRYGRCSPEDIQLLRSRCVTLSDDNVDVNAGNVALIVGRNIQRDVCNEMGVEAFAARNNVELVSFVSRDSHTHGKDITRFLQIKLHDLRPCRTEHLAGCLRLCIGLPVMIKENVATELCVTNGAEGIVRGWQSSLHKGKYVLDVVFVELVSPARDVMLDGLPLNVVPITPIRKNIKAKLQNDVIMSVSRLQVPLLPNFAMTDYASQGRTRPINPIDTRGLKDHKSIYTVFSRSTRLKGTYVIGDIDESKIQRGISGWLRQEYRELEILADITSMEIHGTVSSTFSDLLTRKDKIMEYRKRFGNHHLPVGISQHITYFENEPVDILCDPALWKRVSTKGTDDRPVVTKVQSQNRKRKRTPDTADELDFEHTKIRSKRLRPNRDADTSSSNSHRRMTGCTWDSKDWSCAYDSVFTLLYHIQRVYVPFTGYSVRKRIMRRLVSAYQKINDTPSIGSMNEIRNEQRVALHRLDPLQFPFGHAYAGVYSICDVYLEHIYSHNIIYTRLLTHDAQTKLISIEPQPDCQVQNRLELKSRDNITTTWHIVAAIYGDGHHFTARFMDREHLYAYDGQTSGYLDRQHLSGVVIDWTRLENRTACLLFYIME